MVQASRSQGVRERGRHDRRGARGATQEGRESAKSARMLHQ